MFILSFILFQCSIHLIGQQINSIDDIERVSGFSPVLGIDAAYAEWESEYS